MNSELNLLKQLEKYISETHFSSVDNMRFSLKQVLKQLIVKMLVSKDNNEGIRFVDSQKGELKNNNVKQIE